MKLLSLPRLARILTAVLVIAAAAPMVSASDETTQDVILMNDGREFSGRILKETATQVVFEYINTNLGIRTQLTLNRDEIFQIKRDVPVETPAVDPQQPARPGAAPASGDQPKRQIGTTRSQDTSTPGVYIVPMVGQMGTDVHPDVYKEIAADIRQIKPALVVIKLDSKDFEENLMTMIEKQLDQKETSLLKFDQFYKLADLFRDELRGTPQVVWIHDSMGVSSMVALAWDQIYMTPTARLGGMKALLQQTGADQISDEDVRAKMMAAWIGHAKSLLDYGGYSHSLAEAMIRADRKLSASWKGREVDWMLDETGEYIVDSSPERTVNFVAKDAEDLCISDGTAESLDDLALLLGMREYHVIEGRAESLTEDYVADWRRTYENAKKLLEDYQKYSGWAGGGDALKYMGRAKSALERVVAAMERYEAVELRLGMDGVRKFDLETRIEQMKEEIRALRGSG